MTTPEEGVFPEIVAEFNRHTVPIFIEIQRDGETQRAVFSAFVMSVRGQWLLMTAGHCIDTIENAKKAGFRILRCLLFDSTGLDAKHLDPIPFDWESAVPTKLCYCDTYDYGIVFLSDLYVRLLEANGISPLTEDVWDKQPSDPAFYCLLGIPYESFRLEHEIAHFKSALIPVNRLSERPPGFAPTDAPTFWGQLPHSDAIENIEGMSGGPVLSFATVDGRLRYWLHAMQSRWLRSTRQIAACEMRPLGVFLTEVMDGMHEHLLPESDKHQLS